MHFADFPEIVSAENQLQAIWSVPENRETLLPQLRDHGHDQDRPGDIRRFVDSPDGDLFNVLSYIFLRVRQRHGMIEPPLSDRTISACRARK